MAGNLKAFLAEFIGTFALVLAGAGSVCVNAATGGKLGAVGIALAYGLAAAAMLYVYGGASGGHLNPALTGALWLHRKIPGVKAVFYVGAQLLAAAAAAVALKAVMREFPDFTNVSPFLGACELSGVGYQAGTLIEAVGTFFWVSAYYGTGRDNAPSTARAENDLARGTGACDQSLPTATPPAVAAILVSGALVLGPLTGAAFNPARQFGPAIVTGHWNHWFVYWIGPLAGATLASWIYETIYSEKRDDAQRRGR